MTASLEGILLDPVYTGKAMAGLIGLARQGRWRKGEKVLFLHTGGSPGAVRLSGRLQEEGLSRCGRWASWAAWARRRPST